MYRTILSAAVLLCFVASSLSADDKITIGRKREPGTFVTTMKMKSDQQISGPKDAKISTDMTMTLETTVDKPTDDGQQVHLIYRRIEMKMSGPQEMSYDSAAADENADNPVAAQFKELLDKKITATLDAKGNVTKVEGADKMGEKAIKDMLNQSLPDKPVAPGDKWETTTKQALPGGESNMKMVSTLRKVETVDGKKLAIIDVDGTLEKKADAKDPEASGDGEKPQAKPKIDLHVKGTVKLDVATGQAVESEMVADTSMEMGPMTMKGKSTISTATKAGKYEAPAKKEKPAEKTEDAPKATE